jgi:type IV pilus assembly protein PilE
MRPDRAGGRAAIRTTAGMTLIELMIVIVVVAMLASLAVPGYRSYVLRTHRVEARTALLNLAAAQEKFYLVNNTYATRLQLTEAPPDGLGLSATTENGWYMIAIADGADAAGFTATATATGSQTADRDCTTFTINQLGQKTATRSGGGVSTACWN